VAEESSRARGVKLAALSPQLAKADTASLILPATPLLPIRAEGLARQAWVPGVKVIALLVNQNSSQGQWQIKDVQEAARGLGQHLVILNGGSDEEIDSAFASLAPQQVGALLVGSDPFFDPRRAHLIALAARYSVPILYHFRDFPMEGGLLSYGASITELYQQVGVYVGRILKGDKAADLPVLLPSKFELIINLKTAKALGLTIPPGVLAIADEVIE